MLSPERRRMQFVAALLKDGSARVIEGHAVVAGGGAGLALDHSEVRELVSAGVLTMDGSAIRPTVDARTWLRRQTLEPADSFAGQHRTEASTSDGRRINLAESPLSRLACASKGEAAFLSPHQVEAGERVRLLAERARIQPRVTMSYSAAQVAGGNAAGHAAEIGDMAADARRALAEIHRVLPRDCAGVVLDVCGLLKGLQVVEHERGWPRRSAKLVLRIGLEQLAKHYGLSTEAVGPDSRRRRVWLDEGARPDRFD